MVPQHVTSKIVSLLYCFYTAWLGSPRHLIVVWSPSGDTRGPSIVIEAVGGLQPSTLSLRCSSSDPLVYFHQIVPCSICCHYFDIPVHKNNAISKAEIVEKFSLCLCSHINQLKISAANTTFHCVLRSSFTRRHLTQYKPKQY